MAVQDQDPDQQPSTVGQPRRLVRFGDVSGATVTIGEATDPFKDGFGFVDVLVAIEAGALSAQAWVRSIEGESPVALHRFLREVADDWKGLDGNRSWESIDHDLMVRCSRGALGHLSLTFTLRGNQRSHPWLAEVTLKIEAGEEIAKLARDVEHVLRGDS